MSCLIFFFFFFLVYIFFSIFAYHKSGNFIYIPFNLLCDNYFYHQGKTPINFQCRVWTSNLYFTTKKTLSIKLIRTHGPYLYAIFNPRLCRCREIFKPYIQSLFFKIINMHQFDETWVWRLEIPCRLNWIIL